LLTSDKSPALFFTRGAKTEHMRSFGKYPQRKQELPLCCFAKMSITMALFQPNFTPVMYSTKIHMLTILLFNFKEVYSV